MSMQKQHKQTKKGKRRLPKGSGTYFRVTYETHINLSKQADHKAHLMLGLNTFVLSLVVARHHKGVLMQVDMFFYPNLLLVAFSLAVVVLAVLASRPMLPRRPEKQTPNWLFFGSFAAFPYRNFEENLSRLMHDEGALQEALTQDIMLLGKALARKYRYLALCYLVFGFGVLTVTLMYLLAWAVHG